MKAQAAKGIRAKEKEIELRKEAMQGLEGIRQAANEFAASLQAIESQFGSDSYLPDAVEDHDESENLDNIDAESEESETEESKIPEGDVELEDFELQEACYIGDDSYTINA